MSDIAILTLKIKPSVITDCHLNRAGCTCRISRQYPIGFVPIIDRMDASPTRPTRATAPSDRESNHGPIFVACAAISASALSLSPSQFLPSSFLPPAARSCLLRSPSLFHLKAFLPFLAPRSRCSSSVRPTSGHKQQTEVS